MPNRTDTAIAQARVDSAYRKWQRAAQLWEMGNAPSDWVADAAQEYYDASDYLDMLTSHVDLAAAARVAREGMGR